MRQRHEEESTPQTRPLFPLLPQRLDGGHHRCHTGTCASRMAGVCFFDFRVLEFESQTTVVICLHIQVSFQECTTHHGDVVYLIGDVLEDQVARGEIQSSRPTWVMLCGTAGEKD